MNTTELRDYYANLLILQYLGKPKAYQTIQAIVTPVIMPQVTIEQLAFSLAPTSGTFTLTYDTFTTAPINWNDSAAAIQTKLQALPGLSTVTVTGSIASQNLIVTFTGVEPIALILVVGSNSLMSSGDAVTITVTEIDVTLPVAVQDAFNVTGPDTAQGVQLDVIGDYVGAARTSPGFTQQITLDDADYLTLIQLAIIENNAGSSLAEIVELLNQFFPNEIFVIDNKDMTMDYIISSLVGSQDLIQVFITQGRLPRPMAVRIKSIIYGPTNDLYFGFRTYAGPAMHSTPFNTYAAYNTTWIWLKYSNVIII